jgi:hypothetical protein
MRLGEWQSLQPQIFTRYSPLATMVALSGAAAVCALDWVVGGVFSAHAPITNGMSNNKRVNFMVKNNIIEMLNGRECTTKPITYKWHMLH